LLNRSSSKIKLDVSKEQEEFEHLLNFTKNSRSDLLDKTMQMRGGKFDYTGNMVDVDASSVGNSQLILG
jgi:hypothetical protein